MENKILLPERASLLYRGLSNNKVALLAGALGISIILLCAINYYNYFMSPKAHILPVTSAGNAFGGLILLSALASMSKKVRAKFQEIFRKQNKDVDGLEGKKIAKDNTTVVVDTNVEQKNPIPEKTVVVVDLPPASIGSNHDEPVVPQPLDGRNDATVQNQEQVCKKFEDSSPADPRPVVDPYALGEEAERTGDLSTAVKHYGIAAESGHERALQKLQEMILDENHPQVQEARFQLGRAFFSYNINYGKKKDEVIAMLVQPSQLFYKDSFLLLLGLSKKIPMVFAKLILALKQSPFLPGTKELFGATEKDRAGSIDIAQAREIVLNLNKHAPKGIQFDETAVEPELSGGVCTAKSLRFLDAYLAQRSPESLIEFVRSLEPQFFPNTQEVRTEQAAYNAIEVTNPLLGDMSKAKVEALVAHRSFSVVSASEEVDVTAFNDLSQIFDGKDGIYLIRMLKQGNNKKCEQYGHSMIYIQEQGTCLLYDSNEGAFHIPPAQVNESLVTAMGRYIVTYWLSNIRMYRLNKKS